jgi:hypothetical protein
MLGEEYPVNAMLHKHIRKIHTHIQICAPKLKSLCVYAVCYFARELSRGRLARPSFQLKAAPKVWKFASRLSCLENSLFVLSNGIGRFY